MAIDPPVPSDTADAAMAPCPWCNERRQSMQPFGGIKLPDGREMTGWAIVCGAGNFCPISLFGFQSKADAIALYGRRMVSGQAVIHWQNLGAKQGDSNVADQHG